jgi:hypothetical protein
MLSKILTSLCLSGLLAFSISPQTAFAPDSKQVEDVHEASFRYFFTHELIQSRAEAFCISSAKSLAPNFVKRFANNDPPVVWLSECPIGPPKSGPLMNKKNPAVHIGIMSVRWISPVEVEVRGHCRSGELGGNQELLHLTEKNGRWIVIGAKVEVIS